MALREGLKGVREGLKGLREGLKGGPRNAYAVSIILNVSGAFRMYLQMCLETFECLCECVWRLPNVFGAF